MQNRLSQNRYARELGCVGLAKASVLMCALLGGACGGDSDNPATDGGLDAPVGDGGLGLDGSPDGDQLIPDAQQDTTGDSGQPGDGGVLACAPTGAQSFGAGASVSPALLWNGTNYAIVWGDARADAPGIYLAKLDANGLPGAAPAVLVGAGTKFVKNAEIAALGTGYFVVWEECEQVNGAMPNECDLWGVRGHVLDAAFVPTNATIQMSVGRPVERRPYVLSALGKTFVTYREVNTDETPQREFVTLFAIDANGARLSDPNPRTFEVAQKNVQFPYLAANSTHLALVYTVDGTQPEVNLALLDGNLGLVREAKLRQGQTGKAENPQAVWAGNEWLVAWEDGRTGQAVAWASYVAADATAVRTPFSLFNGQSNWPSVAYNGNTSLALFYGFPDGAQVIGQQLASTGVPLGQPIGVSPLTVQYARYPAALYNSVKMEYAVVYVDRESKKAIFVRLPCPM